MYISIFICKVIHVANYSKQQCNKKNYMKEKNYIACNKTHKTHERSKIINRQIMDQQMNVSQTTVLKCT